MRITFWCVLSIHTAAEWSEPNSFLIRALARTMLGNSNFPEPIFSWVRGSPLHPIPYPGEGITPPSHSLPLDALVSCSRSLFSQYTPCYEADCSIPHGSVLGPVQFVVYTGNIIDIAGCGHTSMLTFTDVRQLVVRPCRVGTLLIIFNSMWLRWRRFGTVCGGI